MFTSIKINTYSQKKSYICSIEKPQKPELIYSRQFGFAKDWTTWLVIIRTKINQYAR